MKDGALVVVAEIGVIGLRDEVLAVLIEEDPRKSVAVVDIDEEAAKNIEAEESGDLDSSGVAGGRQIEGYLMNALLTRPAT
jgi:hypothetical protein